MTSRYGSTVAAAQRPKPEDYSYDLDAALAAVVGLHAMIPEDAFTAGTLGTERLGHGVLIRPDLVLTIGYLVTEAETIWLRSVDGRVVQGHPLGVDFSTGFGLVQALGDLDAPVLPLGSAASLDLGERLVLAGGGGRAHAVATRLVGRQEFAGYWEYVLEEGLFLAPAHPHWGGTALIGPQGDLVGIGSLQLEREGRGSRTEPVNLAVPIDLLPPVLDDLTKLGRPNRPARPWLGLYATDVDGRIVVMGLADDGPADRAGVRPGDVVLGVGGTPVGDLAGFFRRVWSLGDAGVGVPLKLWRDDESLDITVRSGDRERFLKGPKLH